MATFTLSTGTVGSVPSGTTHTIRVVGGDLGLDTKDTIRDRNDGATRRRKQGRRQIRVPLQIEILESNAATLMTFLMDNSKDDANAIYFWWHNGTSYESVWLKPSGSYSAWLKCWVQNPKLNWTPGKYWKITCTLINAWETTLE